MSDKNVIDNNENNLEEKDFEKYLNIREEQLLQKIRRNQMDKRSSDWTENKFETLSNWMKISAFYISINDKCINRYKILLKANTIVNLILSTLSGTISVFNYNATEYTLSSTMLFTCATFGITLFSGYIKVDQVQEKLEEFIKLKQEWTQFSAALSSELVLPLNLRQSSVTLINKYKGKFLDLIKTDVEYPPKYKQMIREEGYSLSQIINNFVDHEDLRLKERGEKDIPDEEAKEWKAQNDHEELMKKNEHRRLYQAYDEEFRIYHRENKLMIQQKYPSAKPREISDKLYTNYQQLMFDVKKDIKYFIELYGYIELAIEERNRRMQFIDQEYQVLINENDTGFSTFALNNWYKEHVQCPEMSPSQITNALIDKYNTSDTIIQNRKIWEYKMFVHQILLSIIIIYGPASLVYFTNEFSTNLFSRLNNNSEEFPNNEEIIDSFKAGFAKYSESEKYKMTEIYISKIIEYEYNLNLLSKNIIIHEQELQHLFYKFNTSSRKTKIWDKFLSYTIGFNNKYFDNIMMMIGSTFKGSREKLQMYKNPFYRILLFNGFDYKLLFPEFVMLCNKYDSIETLLENQQDIIQYIAIKYKYIQPVTTCSLNSKRFESTKSPGLNNIINAAENLQKKIFKNSNKCNVCNYIIDDDNDNIILHNGKKYHKYCIQCIICKNNIMKEDISTFDFETKICSTCSNSKYTVNPLREESSNESSESSTPIRVAPTPPKISKTNVSENNVSENNVSETIDSQTKNEQISDNKPSDTVIEIIDDPNYIPTTRAGMLSFSTKVI